VPGRKVGEPFSYSLPTSLWQVLRSATLVAAFFLADGILVAFISMPAQRPPAFSWIRILNIILALSGPNVGRWMEAVELRTAESHRVPRRWYSVDFGITFIW
jgi:hypothetical protein